MTTRPAKDSEPMKSRIMGSVLAIASALVISARDASAFPLLAQSWRELNPKQRYDALQNYKRHQQLPEEQQRDVEKRYERWQGLSPEERARIRENYDHF